MMIKYIVSLFLCIGIGIPAFAGDDAIPCRIHDPKDRTLNVRDEPNGKIIGNLRNGTKVNLLGNDKDSKKRIWGLIQWDKPVIEGTFNEGWVLYSHLRCQKRGKR